MHILEINKLVAGQAVTGSQRSWTGSSSHKTREGWHYLAFFCGFQSRNKPPPTIHDHQQRWNQQEVLHHQFNGTSKEDIFGD